MEMEEGGREEKGSPIFRDIRRYYCHYCGLCRSKKSLIASHVLSHHKEDIKEKEVANSDGGNEETKLNTCEECGVSFRKPAYLKQHMQCHSLETCRTPKCEEATFFYLEWTSNRLGDLLRSSIKQASFTHLSNFYERPFTCPVDDCHSSYRRKDHLTRHLLQHQGKLFSCPVKSCKSRFSYQGNMKRHAKERHNGGDDSGSCDGEGQKHYVCPEIGCEKVFKFASKLRKHEDFHVKLDSVEAICGEPGCMKSFTNVEYLKAHIQSCHRYISCEVCGTKQLRKNIKRHMRTHEAGGVSERIKCSFKGCPHTFSNKSNLNQHIKAVHHDLRPFICQVTGCGKKFPYRHVRDNHEKTGSHVYIQGNFEEYDEQSRSRPRGGRKRKYPTMDLLIQRKRVAPLNQALDSVLNRGSDYLSWLLSATEEDLQ